MSRMTWAVFAWAFLAIPAFAADDTKPAKRTDATAELLKKLSSTPNIAEGDFRFSELPGYLEKVHSVPVVVNTREFQKSGIDLEEAKLKFTPSNSLSLSVQLNHVLGQIQATYLVRKGHIEILPIRVAVRETKNLPKEDDGESVMRVPLVSVILKEKPLNEAIADIAEEFNLTVVMSPKAGDAQTGFVSARLLNVPADHAIELLALQCDLRVVRKGTTYMITSRDHATDLFNEKMDRDRAKAEVDNLRNQRLFGWGGFGIPPAPAPAPNPAPAPAPEAKP